MIDWTKINNDEKFRDLCNYLLKEELGWPFLSVSKGRDDLQDASYTGDYKNKIGSWIFQYKWLNLENGKSKNRSLLKSTLVGGRDPECKRVSERHNPDHYVVLTNIDLTLPQKIEITKKAQDYGLKDAIVWDQADLEILLNTYPSALIRHFEQNLPILEHYSQRFSIELNDASSPLYFGDKDLFLGRENDVKEIEKLIADTSRKIILIHGPGGIGKTRFIVEVCRFIETSGKDTRTYFIRGSSDIKIQDILRELPSRGEEIKTLVLVFDDVQVFSRELLFELSTLFRANPLINSKLVLITRPELKDQVLHQLPIRSETIDISIYQLENLNISDIGKIIKAKISDVELVNQLIAWASRGRWSPMEANLIINEAIKSNTSFRNAVNESQILERLFNRYLESYSNDARVLIELIAFLQPFQFEEEQLKKTVLQYFNWNERQYINVIDELASATTIEVLTWGANRYKLRPDILADWLRDKASYTQRGLLTQRCKSIVKTFLPVTTEQLITNLAQTEFDKQEKILDDFLKEFESEILKGNNFERIQLLKLLKKIAWFRPLEALQIIKKLIAQPGKIYIPEGLEWAKYDHSMVVADIPEILSDIAYHLEYFSEVIDVLFKLSISDMGRGASNARERFLQLCQIKYRRSLEYNQKVVDYLNNIESITDEKIATFITDIIKKQFVTHIDYDYLDPENPRVLHWTSFPIKAVYSPKGFEQLQKLRENGLLLLFKTISTDYSWFVRKLGIEALSSIADGLLHQSQPMRATPLEEQEKYPSEPELGKILKFLEKYLEIELKQKIPDFRVLDAIIGFVRIFRERKTEYDTILKEIKESIKKKDEYCMYDLLIAEHRDWDKDLEDQKKGHLNNPAIKRILQKYKDSPDDFLEFLNNLLSLREGWVFGSVKKLATEIGEQYKELAEKIIDKIKSGEYPALIIYGGSFIIGIRNKDILLAKAIVDRLTAEQNITGQRIAVNSYDKYWVIDHQEKRPIGITANELKFLERLKDSANADLKLELARACSVFLLLDKLNTLELLATISQSIGKEDFILVEAIADALDPRDVGFVSEDLQLLKRIILNFIPVADLDKNQMMYWHIEQILELVLKSDPGFIIDFYEARIKYKNNLQKNEEYDAVPYRVEFPKIGGNPQEFDLCRRIRNWAQEKNWFRLEAPRFFRNFGFSIPIISAVLNEWIENNESDPEKKHELIVLAAYLLRDFNDTEWLYDQLAKILVKASYYDADDEKYKDIMSEVFACIHTGGSWGDTKHRKIIEQLNRILTSDDSLLSSRVKADLKEEIKRQEAEVKHMNDLLNADWE